MCAVLKGCNTASIVGKTIFLLRVFETNEGVRAGGRGHVKGSVPICYLP